MGSGKSTILSTITRKLQKKLSKQAVDKGSINKQKKSKDTTKRALKTNPKIAQKASAPSRLLVFSFKTGDDKTQTTESLLWNLIAQIYDYCDKRRGSAPELIAGCDEIINDLLEKERDRGSGQMRTARGKHKSPELQRTLQNFAKVAEGEFFVIIDALDECIDRGSEGLIDVIKGLSTQFKILFPVDQRAMSKLPLEVPLKFVLE